MLGEDVGVLAVVQGPIYVVLHIIPLIYDDPHNLVLFVTLVFLQPHLKSVFSLIKMVPLWSQRPRWQTALKSNLINILDLHLLLWRQKHAEYHQRLILRQKLTWAQFLKPFGDPLKSLNFG